MWGDGKGVDKKTTGGYRSCIGSPGGLGRREGKGETIGRGGEGGGMGGWVANRIIKEN